MIPKLSLKEKLGIPYGTIFTTNGDNRYFFQKVNDKEMIFKRVTIDCDYGMEKWFEDGWEYDEELTKRFENEYNEIKVIETPPDCYTTSFNEIYWYGIIKSGKFHVCYTFFFGSSADYSRYYTGNFFKTKEEAEAKAEDIVRKVYSKFEEDKKAVEKYEHDTWWVKMPNGRTANTQRFISDIKQSILKIRCIGKEFKKEIFEKEDLEDLRNVSNNLNKLIKELEEEKDEKFS